MQRTLLLIALVLLAGCGASAGPLDEPAVRAAVLAAFAELDTGIEREDPFLASNPAASLFGMNSNIAVRYADAGISGTGPAALRGLFGTTFALHANILHQTTLQELQLNGEVATVKAEVQFNSLRVDRVPPENFTSTSSDTFLFTLERGTWKILVWDETPPVEEPEQTSQAD